MSDSPDRDKTFAIDNHYVDGLGAARDVDGAIIDELVAAMERGGTASDNRFLPPVQVLWADSPPRLRFLPSAIGTSLEGELIDDESGIPVQSLRGTVASAEDGTAWLSLEHAPEPGYYRVALRGSEDRAWLFTAPRKTYAPSKTRQWGVFLPFYALHSDRGSGGADFTDVRTALAWAGDRGADIVATLPLMPAFLDAPCDPSPYAPVSRLFWNELYLDPTQCAGFERSTEAKNRLAGYKKRLAELSAEPHVAPKELMAIRRDVLEALADAAFAQGDPADFCAYREERAEIDNYALFRARQEIEGANWRAWTREPPAQSEELERRARYHRYVQWQSQRQVETLVKFAGERGVGLYLDVPVGVHGDAFDTYRWPRLFLDGCAVGAPPDLMFTGGQNWGFPPLNPERIRHDGYAYLRECIAHQMKFASVLRVDHVMGLHRLYTIPAGRSSAEGTFINYSYEELYAIFSIESHRHRTMLVGEDLGTVPPKVRTAMDAHAFRRMHVIQLLLLEGRDWRSVPNNAQASFNTHDLPMFRTFLEGGDIDDRIELGLTTPENADTERREREALRRQLEESLGVTGYDNTVLALLQHLAESPSPLLLLTLEDLWGELRPQNQPGTASWERPNWVRKMVPTLAELSSDKQVDEILRMVAAARALER